MFYIEITERLFYGLTRYLYHLNNETNELVEVKIKIDSNDEYDKLFLNDKIIEQMNVYSAYKNKNYRVSKVIILQDSSKSIPLKSLKLLLV